ncbi:MAG: serine/threonine protein kinase, partial [Planctomycetaceae bacterium]|nr:serine/threonine protein kinase [Planctomycetaceae bacterium]
MANAQSIDCFPPDVLAAFARGDIREDDRLEAIGAHLDTCPACLANVEALSADRDHLLEAIRSSSVVDDVPSEPSFRDALRQVLELPHAKALQESTASPHGATVGPGSHQSSAAYSPAPLRVGDYDLLEPIGTGGMGVVYRALHRHLRREVALKVLRAERLESADAQARFRHEVDAVNRVSSRYVVGASDAGEVDGLHYLAMELLDGVNLSVVANGRAPLHVADACEIARQAALGLSAAHEHGLVHRDFKPSNLMLCWSDDGEQSQREPVVKLLDLGLSRFDTDDRTALTSVDQIMGTIDYMAPEQCIDSRTVDIRADLYSLGATLTRLLAGSPPWSGPGYETKGAKLRALLTEAPPSIG